MSRYEPRLGTPRRDRERQPIERVKHHDRIEFRNPATNETVSVGLDASHAEIAKARKQLRPDAQSVYDQNAKTVVQKMYGTKQEAASDPEPIVSMTPGVLQRKQQAAHDLWSQKREAARLRDQQLRDRHALVNDLRDALADRELPESTPAEPAPVDLTDVYRQRLEATMALSKAQRTGESAENISRLEAANRAAWGLPEPSPELTPEPDEAQPAGG